MSEERLSYLFSQYYQNKASEAEVAELGILLEQPNDESLSALLKKSWEEQSGGTPFFARDTSLKMLETILKKDAAAPVYRMPARGRWLSRVAAAAVLILLIGGGYLLWTNGKKGQLATATKPAVKDIPPGRTGAILTLANGKQVVLDSAGNGVVANEGGSRAEKKDGTLSYQNTNAALPAVYNTMTTPRGRQYFLQLADGSKVWLNAESAIRFPTAFNGHERRVEITGEAYFEVAKDPARKFMVTSNGVTTEVLGTHFNVNAYNDEEAVKVTLLEGAVKVRQGSNSNALKPGQQASIKNGITVDEHADTESALAWKNGQFRFNGVSIETIMRQAARWYDIDVVFEGKIAGPFVADISRDVPISSMLHLLELTDRAHFIIEGKKVIVRP